MQRCSYFDTSGPAAYGSRGTSGGARADSAVSNPLVAFFGADRSSGAAQGIRCMTSRRTESQTGINITIRDSGMRSEGPGSSS